jgi:hypothetical protein
MKMNKDEFVKKEEFDTMARVYVRDTFKVWFPGTGGEGIDRCFEILCKRIETIEKYLGVEAGLVKVKKGE